MYAPLALVNVAVALVPSTTAEALEQTGAELALQGLQLQGDRGLAEKEGFRRARNRAQTGGLAEGAQRFEAVTLVVKAGLGFFLRRFRHDFPRNFHNYNIC